MINTRKRANKIFDDSTHALNVLFHIMQEILLCNLIRVNCILYMALDLIFQLMDVLIYPTIIVLNIIHTIRQALKAFSKPGTYVE